MSRPAQPGPITQSAEAQAQLGALSVGAPAALREYLYAEYPMLCTVVEAEFAAYLLSIRHHRKLALASRGSSRVGLSRES